MGFDHREVRITARVSRHNSPRDDRDDDEWERFLRAVRYLIKQRTFEHIELTEE